MNEPHQPAADITDGITGDKRPPEVRRQSEEKYYRLFETINAGFCLCAPIRDENGKMIDYRLLELNPAFEKLTGLNARHAVGKTILELMPRLDQWWIDTYRHVVDTRETVRFERFLPELGRWYDLTAFYCGEDQFATYYDDITGRKRHEANLAFLNEVSQDLIRLTEIDQTMNAVSEKIAAYLGLSACALAELKEQASIGVINHGWHRSDMPSLLGTYRMDEFVSPEVMRSCQAGEAVIIRDVFEDSRTDGEQYAALKIGSFVSMPLVREGAWRFLLVVYRSEAHDWGTDEIDLLRELTTRIWTRLERARMEEALRKSEEEFRLLGIASSDSIYKMSPDWAQMHQLTGKTFLADTNDSNSSWLEVYIPLEDQPQVQQRIQAAILTKSTFEFEHRVRRADGTVGWTSSRAIPVLDEQGAIREWLGAASDITARKQADKMLREADQRKDEFLAMLAHELRNPLATIRSGLQILTLIDGKEQTTGPTVGSATIAMMDRQADHLARLVDDLLDVSRISQGKIELKPQRVNLVELVAQAAQSVGTFYQEQGRRLQVEVPVHPIYVNGDSARLSQVVTNLLTNGARYTEELGQVWLRLSPLAGASGRQEALIEVRDNGIGLAADQLVTVFDLFVQVDNSLARSKGGLGLGLTLVKRLVELHGGGVEAQSEGIGKGSTFRVHLPTLNPAPEEALPAAAGRTAGSSTQRILVIDDNADAALTLSMLLTLKGYEVHTRHSGHAGLEAAEVLKPGIVLLDIGMPGLDGYETCQLLRQQPWGKALVVLALSGYGQGADKQRTQQSGFDGHLVKPVELEALIGLLTSLPEKADQNPKAGE